MLMTTRRWPSRQRKRILDMAATNEFFVIGYHMPFPGIGFVERAHGSYRWVPHSLSIESMKSSLHGKTASVWISSVSGRHFGNDQEGKGRRGSPVDRNEPS